MLVLTSNHKRFASRHYGMNMTEWYRLILYNSSQGHTLKGRQQQLPPSTRNEDFFTVASIPQSSTSTDAPPSITCVLRKDALSHLSTLTGQCKILGHPFSDPFIAQAYDEIMAKRLRGHIGPPENTARPKKRQKVLPTKHINGSSSHPVSPESPVESDSESVSDGPQYHIHGNCDSKKWNEIFDNLVAFKEEHGHCCVPQHYKPNIYLSQWVKRQRYYRKHRPELTSESRIQKLDELGFVWDAQEDFWKTRFEELKAYKHMHGHCNVPCKYSANQKLATWVKCQRRQYKLRTMGKPSGMTEERIFLLEELGFVWKIRGPDVGSQCVST
eukprot:scaffold8128_cov60-Cylindrotheca_fusiformis.AAC.6